MKNNITDRLTTICRGIITAGLVGATVIAANPTFADSETPTPTTTPSATPAPTPSAPAPDASSTAPSAATPAPTPTAPNPTPPTPAPQAPPIPRPPLGAGQGMPPGFNYAPPPPPAQPTEDSLKPGHVVTLPAQIIVSGVAARVNGEPITNEELVKTFLRNGGQTALNELITTVELEQAAKKQHITVTDAEITQRLRQTKLQFVQRYAGQTWSQILASKGLSEDYARSQTRLELLVEKLAVANGPKYSLDGKVHIYHILIATVPISGPNTPHTDAEAKAKITQILADIRAHKISFLDAAKQYSEDSSNASKGGDLGWVSSSDPLDDAFKKAAFALKEGEISDPVKSQFGYHLIYAARFGKNATAAELKKASDDSMMERSRPMIQSYVQQLQDSSHVENLLIPIPPKPKNVGFNRGGPGMMRPSMRTLHPQPLPGATSLPQRMPPPPPAPAQPSDMPPPPPTSAPPAPSK